MRKKEYLKSRSVIVQGIHSPKRFWFACGLSLGLVSLPLSTFANNWSNQLGSSIQKSKESLLYGPACFHPMCSQCPW